MLSYPARFFDVVCELFRPVPVSFRAALVEGDLSLMFGQVAEPLGGCPLMCLSGPVVRLRRVEQSLPAGNKSVISASLRVLEAAHRQRYPLVSSTRTRAWPPGRELS
jgi:hypothetical protein